MENQTVKVKRKKNNKNVSKCLPGLRSANFIRELTKISIVRRRGNKYVKCTNQSAGRWIRHILQ